MQGPQLGRGLPYPLTALVLPFGTRVKVWGLPRTSVPEASTKDTAGPGPHWAGPHVQYVEGSLGQWEGGGTAAFPVYSIYVTL